MPKNPVRALKNTTAMRKKLAVEAYKTHYTLADVARLIGVSPGTVYKWKRDDPEFAAALAESDEIYADYLRNVVFQRAVTGIDEVVIYKGEVQFQRDTRGYLVLDDNFEAVPLTRKVTSDLMLSRLIESKAHEFKREKNTGVKINAGIEQFNVQFLQAPKPEDWENPHWGEDGRLTIIEGKSTEIK